MRKKCVYPCADWTHPPAVPGQTNPEAQEAIPVCRPGPLWRGQHQPYVRERLPERQSPQSCCSPTAQSHLTVQPRVPQPLPCHPKLQRYHCAQQHSATHSRLQAARQRSQGDCQRHGLGVRQRGGEGRRQKRLASDDLTWAQGAAGRTVFELLPSFFLRSQKTSSSPPPSGQMGGRLLLSSFSWKDCKKCSQKDTCTYVRACVLMCVRLEQCTHTNCTVCIKCEHVCIHMYKLIFYTKL